MKRFEYMTKRVAFFHKNPHENEGDDYTALACLTQPALPIIGQEGWELVQILQNPAAQPDEPSLYAIFKREIPTT